MNLDLKKLMGSIERDAASPLPVTGKKAVLEELTGQRKEEAEDDDSGLGGGSPGRDGGWGGL